MKIEVVCQFYFLFRLALLDQKAGSALVCNIHHTSVCSFLLALRYTDAQTAAAVLNTVGYRLLAHYGQTDRCMNVILMCVSVRVLGAASLEHGVLARSASTRTRQRATRVYEILDIAFPVRLSPCTLD